MIAVPRLTPFAKQLLIGFFAAYVAELVLENWVGVPIFDLFALHYGSLGVHTIWQCLTYTLVWPAGPDSVFSVLLGLVFLWWTVAPFEERFGKVRTAQLCLVTTFAASAPAITLGVVFSGANAYPPLYGFNPIILGSISAFAYWFRGRGTMSFFGVLPMKAEHMILAVLGLSVLFFLASRNVVELLADIGAVCGGVLFTRWMTRPRNPTRSTRASQDRFRVISGKGGRDVPKRWLN